MWKQELKIVPVAKLLPNPFRNIKDYPIDEEKVALLEESYRETGVWPNILARPAKGGKYEIAYGHHRMAAMKKSKFKEVAIVVTDMDDETMFKTMVRENDEVYGVSAYGDLEMVEEALKGFLDGKWEYELAPKGAHKESIKTFRRGRAEIQYSPNALAAFLGKTKIDDRPAEPVIVGLLALDAIKDKIVKRRDARGLSRHQAKKLVLAARKVEKAAQENADKKRRDAEEAKKRAEKIKDARKRLAARKAAESLERVAETAEKNVPVAAADFVDDAANKMRKGSLAADHVAAEAAEVVDQYTPVKIDLKYKQLKDAVADYAGDISTMLNDSQHDSIVTMLQAKFGMRQAEKKRLLVSVRALLKRAESFARQLEESNAEPVKRSVTQKLIAGNKG